VQKMVNAPPPTARSMSTGEEAGIVGVIVTKSCREAIWQGLR
jgi:hypothetical protein